MKTHTHPVELTDEQSKWVAGGAATNVFLEAPDAVNPTKVVGTDGHNGYVNGNAQNTHYHYLGF